MDQMKERLPFLLHKIYKDACLLISVSFMFRNIIITSYCIVYLQNSDDETLYVNEFNETFGKKINVQVDNDKILNVSTCFEYKRAKNDEHWQMKENTNLQYVNILRQFNSKMAHSMKHTFFCYYFDSKDGRERFVNKIYKTQNNKLLINSYLAASENQ